MLGTIPQYKNCSLENQVFINKTFEFWEIKIYNFYYYFRNSYTVQKQQGFQYVWARQAHVSEIIFWDLGAPFVLRYCPIHKSKTWIFVLHHFILHLKDVASWGNFHYNRETYSKYTWFSWNPLDTIILYRKINCPQK